MPATKKTTPSAPPKRPAMRTRYVLSTVTSCSCSERLLVPARAGNQVCTGCGQVTLVAEVFSGENLSAVSDFIDDAHARQ